MEATTTAVDEQRLEEFLGQAVTDMGAAMNGVLVMIGGELGLWEALGGAGPLTAAEIAEKTGVSERYVREWASAQAASGYLTYDAEAETFTLPPEQAMAFADRDSPVFMLGGYSVISSAYKDRAKLAERFRKGEGFGWHEHDSELFVGTEQFFRPGYQANLIQSWLPALDGVVPKLEAGAKVADIGCGHGASTIIMAMAFPQSTIVGFDYHPDSIDAARKAAADAGVAERCTFEVASAADYPGTDYDLVCHFDCLHDMGDPVAAATHTRQSLAPDGTWMLVEPFANDDVADNLTPVGRVFYSASTIICTPASLSQEGGAALGAQAGEGRLREVAEAAGFGTFRRATETAFNLVLEGKP